MAKDLSDKSLREFMNAAGRVPYGVLKSYAEEQSEEEFVRFVHYPVLAGSSIADGSIEKAVSKAEQQRRKTMLFRPSEILKMPEPDPLQRAIYPVVKASLWGSQGKQIFLIGRSAENHIVMSDLAISETHAKIEVEHKEYTLEDFNSTNGTHLNGFPIGKKRVKLEDKDKVRFARYDFLFLLPASLHQLLLKQEKHLP